MSRNSLFSSSLATVLVWAVSAGAGTIDFEDLTAANDPLQTLSDEYAHLGVHFSSADDGATWNGLADGDPGAWGIDGSSGPTFLGFDGSSYTVVIDFDDPVQGVELDVARGAGGSWMFDTFTVTGILDHRAVETVAIFLGRVGDWRTISLTQEVNRLHLRGVGLPTMRFAIDNLRWVGDLAESVLSCEIDIRPGSDENAIRLSSRGVVPVVLYGSDHLDVVSIDESTLAFGPGTAGPAHRNGPHFEDVDADGFLDMVIHHRVKASGIGSEDTEACLLGETWDGQLFEGCDVVAPTR
jgi:hypothetical protein